MLVLLFDERISICQKNLTHVLVVSFEELFQRLTFNLVFVGEEHLSGEFFLTHLIGLHNFDFVPQFFFRIYRASHLSQQIKLFRRGTCNRKASRRLLPVNYLRFYSIDLVNELLHELEAGAFVIFMIVIQALVQHRDQRV